MVSNVFSAPRPQNVKGPTPGEIILGYLGKEKPKKVLVLARKIDGFGDIVAADTLTKLMRAALPESEFVTSYYKCTIPEEQQKDQPKARYIDVSTIFGKDEGEFWSLNAVIEQINTFSRIYIYPHPNGDIPKEIMESGVPIRTITEFSDYDFRSNLPSETIYTGLDETREVGIFVSPEWREYRINYKAQTKEQRLYELRHLNHPMLVEAILRAPYSEKAVHDFAENNELYTGHASQDFVKFVFVQVIAEATKGNLTFHFPSLNFKDFDFEEFQTFFPGLAQAGFQHIEYVEIRDNARNKFEVKIKKSTGKRKIRVVICPLSIRESFALRRASSKTELVTGDQSLMQALFKMGTEAEPIMYETRDYKIEAIKAFLKIIGKYSPPLAKRVEMGIKGKKIVHGEDPNVPRLIKEQVALIKELRINQELKTAWKKAIREICDEHNFADYLPSILLLDETNPLKPSDIVFKYPPADPTKPGGGRFIPIKMTLEEAQDEKDLFYKKMVYHIAHCQANGVPNRLHKFSEKSQREMLDMWIPDSLVQ